ncbi:MAG: SPOR domain-containing protein, partial [Spirochaetota bacterium]
RIAAPDEELPERLAKAEASAPSEDGAAVAEEGDLEAEETLTPVIPEDAVVSLEPAELRPPELEDPSKESLETPKTGEEPGEIAARTPTPEIAESEDRVDEEIEPPVADEAEPEEPTTVAELAEPDATLGQVAPPADEFADGAEPPSLAATEPEAPIERAEPPQVEEMDVPEETVAEPRLEPAEERPPRTADRPPAEEAREEPPAEEPPEEPEERVAEAPEAEADEEPLPEEAPAEERVRVGESWARENLPLINTLSPESYYLQVGAFSDPQRAKSAVDNLKGTYPVAVLSGETEDRELYRLFVGPLNEDERGSVLYWIRRKGYQDAFIRKGGA